MKRCGKSAPSIWRQMVQGKPHPEQDQIGALGPASHQLPSHASMMAQYNQAVVIDKKILQERPIINQQKN